MWALTTILDGNGRGDPPFRVPGADFGLARVLGHPRVEWFRIRGQGGAMKTLIALAMLALLGVASAPAQEEADIGMFYSSLGSQGEWISVDGGTYAWRPSGVDAGWRPYSDGHWVWTDDGWYWATDEPWGWATYHYGRWYNDDYYGWVWVPGYEWAPAWVEWRYGDNCVGWAPLSPYAVFSVSWGVHYRRYWATPYYYWSFVDCRYMGYHDLHRYLYRTDENTRFIGRTRTAGSVRYDNGRIVTRVNRNPPSVFSTCPSTDTSRACASNFEYAAIS